VQPTPAPPPAPGRAGRAGEAGRGDAEPPATSPFGAGCPVANAGGGGGFGGGPNLNGPYVIGGVYTITLVVDGKDVEKKSLRVNEDPEVVLTAVERKRMFDQAMEIHALQPRVNEAATAHASLTRQMTELATTIGGRTDVPADVKASFEALNKELAGLAPKLTVPQGRGGVDGSGANDSLSARIGQAKTGPMGCSSGSDGARVYRSEGADNAGDRRPHAVIAKAAALARAGANAVIGLTVPAPIAQPVTAAPVKSRALRCWRAPPTSDLCHGCRSQQPVVSAPAELPWRSRRQQI
jgi:hypothetical protein